MSVKIFTGKSYKYKIGFIGGGIDSLIGATHFRSIALHTKLELVSGMFSVNKGINYKSAKVYNVPKNRVYTDIDTFLKNEKNLDVIVLITPIPGRLRTLTKIFKSKIPLIAEKPLVANLNEIKSIKSLIKKDNFLSVIYNYTGYPMVREMKDIINRKDFFGKLKSVLIEMPSGVFHQKQVSKRRANWNIKDGIIPNIALNLGSHVFNLLYFLTGQTTDKLIAQSSKSFKYKNTIDDLMCIGNLKNNANFNIWFSKAALGHDNGMKIRVYGENASLEWVQTKPEYLTINTNKKQTFKMDRGSSFAKTSKQKRYNYFIPGHPTGYLEAFANHYYDIFENLECFKKKTKFKNNYTFGYDHAAQVIASLDALNRSTKSKRWEKVKY